MHWVSIIGVCTFTIQIVLGIFSLPYKTKVLVFVTCKNKLNIRFVPYVLSFNLYISAFVLIIIIRYLA